MIESPPGFTERPMRYFCTRCRAACEVELFRCPACGEWERYIPDVHLSKRRVESPTILSARQLAARKIDKAPLWSLGELPHLPPLMVAAYGSPGAGKSTWSLRVAADLLRIGHVVMIVASEEGHSDTFADRLRRLEIRDESLYIMGNVPYADVEEAANSRDVTAIILDSWNDSSWTAPDLDAARKSFMFFAVLQATKAGDAAGSNTILHLADIVVHLDDKIACIEKSRWGGSLETPVFEEVA